MNGFDVIGNIFVLCVVFMGDCFIKYVVQVVDIDGYIVVFQFIYIGKWFGGNFF